MRPLPVIFLVALYFIFSSFITLNPNEYKVTSIVIDAGHGGHDSGCRSDGVLEKDVALSIALKLGKIIKENLKDVNVIYTRSDDRFVELWERAAIANRRNADVFISIHCNANDHTGAQGTETFAMGLYKSEANLEVAKRENSVVLLEENYEMKYEGFDPKSPEGHIIFSLFQDAYIDQSLNLASKVEEQFAIRVKRNSRGVKQAGFVVLWKTTMPSILIETGFLTNPKERNYLTSDLGQVYIASGIYRAFKEYKYEFEGKENN